MQDYLPSNDKQLLAFGRNFVAQTLEKPDAFGLTPAQVGAYRPLVERFADLIEKVDDPVRSSPAAREEKKEIKAELSNASRVLVRIVQAYPPLRDNQRTALRIKIPDRIRTRLPAPAAVPIVEVTNVRGRRVFFRVFNADGSRRKPAGVKEVQVFVSVTDESPTDVNMWQYRYDSGRTTNLHVDFDADVAGGTIVWVGVRWANATGTGPFSQPTQTNLQGGGVSPRVKAAS